VASRELLGSYEASQRKIYHFVSIGLTSCAGSIRGRGNATMVEMHITTDDVIGLLHGEEESYRRILAFANMVAWHEARRKHIADPGDIAVDALIEGVRAIQTGACASAEDLERIVKRAVWREAQRSYRHARGIVEVEIDSIPDIARHRLGGQSTLASERKPPAPRLLYSDQRSPAEDALARIDVLAVDKQLIDYLNKHPERMYELNPRRFEELVAAILKDLGYAVQLTAQGADGGVDIIAT